MASPIAMFAGASNRQITVEPSLMTTSVAVALVFLIWMAVDLGVDGPYRVREAASANRILEPIGAAPTGADITVTNAGGAVLPRTDFRLHFVRVMEFTRLITESIGGFARSDQMDAAPVLVTNAVSAVTVTGDVAEDAAAGNPVGSRQHRAANANQAAMSATGDLVHLMATMIGALVQKPYSIPEADWSYTPPHPGRP